ncbi:hypothetical protein LO80_04765 [Candidatus Francisella endociliophora]|uniref:Lipoprotein n=1 Tax=Candidatus Francisella endociliophora TaxID=653937 RepID=A0A097EP57_9GAMM|nr:hypothetical protein [Francisella sp. FSC1006]AIT09347.1 hypothetical protein LO80_04765 [Francisella sp. FSC1006]
MKKLALLILAVFITALISCTNSQGDSFGYVAPPPSEQDLDSNEAGPLQQPGGVAAEIEAEQGNPSHDDAFTIRE